MHTGHLALLIVAILWPLTVTSYTLNCTPSSAAARGPAALPVVSGRAHVAGHSGAVSGPWCALPSSPWPAPFPPRPAPLRPVLDSASSFVLHLVRSLPRYSGAVRRPAPMHHGRAPRVR